MKKISIMMLLMVITVLLTACEKYTCVVCSEEKGGKHYRAVLNEQEIVVCENCYQELTSAFYGE
jgi:uncharacterized CHY-type Zn-finger protein